MSDEIQRVEYDDIEFDDDLALFNEQPFTGIVYEYYDIGQLAYEGFYDEGLPQGLQQDWYRNGQMEGKAYAIRGQGTSESWHWYENGIQKSYRKNDRNGFWVELKEWDEEGNLTRNDKRDPVR
jgi:antitoxin component YwqK of YwqJK toxin-antitoxin module